MNNRVMLLLTLSLAMAVLVHRMLRGAPMLDFRDGRAGNVVPAKVTSNQSDAVL